MEHFTLRLIIHFSRMVSVESIKERISADIYFI